MYVACSRKILVLMYSKVLLLYLYYILVVSDVGVVVLRYSSSPGTKCLLLLVYRTVYSKYTCTGVPECTVVQQSFIRHGVLL